MLQFCAIGLHVAKGEYVIVRDCLKDFHLKVLICIHVLRAAILWSDSMLVNMETTSKVAGVESGPIGAHGHVGW